jgi:phosphoribosylformylglycinamidine (FGAM) synthase-like enzyme
MTARSAATPCSAGRRRRGGARAWHRKALAISTDCTPRYCFADPYEGGKQAVAECWRNLITSAVGAKPLAITNCLNFANPQRPKSWARSSARSEGMGEACRALDFPIVSGNVSLYNESKATGGGSAILPTPAIGGIGLWQFRRNPPHRTARSERLLLP